MLTSEQFLNTYFQLGLTFTVPFLSIPLNAINSIIGGNFGDIGNLFNFNNLGNKYR